VITINPTNDAPVITGQDPLSTPENQSLTIVMDDLTINDPDNGPGEMALSLQSGENYTVSGNTIIPDGGFNGSLTVPVYVNDGIANSKYSTC